MKTVKLYSVHKNKKSAKNMQKKICLLRSYSCGKTKVTKKGNTWNLWVDNLPK